MILHNHRNSDRLYTVQGTGRSIWAAARKVKAAEKAEAEKKKAEAEASNAGDPIVIDDDNDDDDTDSSWGGLGDIDEDVFIDGPAPSPANMFGLLSG